MPTTTLNEALFAAAAALVDLPAGATLNEAEYRAWAAIATGAIPRQIPSSAAYTVGTGGDFATLSAAMTFLNAKVISPDVAVTLTLLDGAQTYASPITIQNSFGRSIFIVGQNTYTKSMSSVQSSSGSAGSRSVIINLDSVANIALNDFVVISGAAGGTNPTYIDGCWKVTNVDAVNTRITVTSTHRAAAAPSGNVTATVTVLKAILQFTGCDGLRNWNGGSTLNIDKCAVIGDNTASTIAIANDDCDRVYVQTVLGVNGFGNGINALQNSQLNSDGIVAVSNCATGFFARLGGAINILTAISSGNTGDGVNVNTGGQFYCGTASVFSGNGNAGVRAYDGGAASVASTTATGNTGWGYIAQSQGFVDDTSTTGANNGSGNSSTGLVAATLSVGGTTIGATGAVQTAGAVNGSNASAFNLRNTASSTTVPTVNPHRADTSSGLGGAQGAPSIITGGAEQAIFPGAGVQKMPKGTDPGTAPGAGFARFQWVTGTNAGTAKLVAYAGTSTTPTTIIDNVGGGF
jgi:hypothetical protein